MHSVKHHLGEPFFRASQTHQARTTLRSLDFSRATKTPPVVCGAQIGSAAWSNPTAQKFPSPPSQTLGFKRGSLLFSQTPRQVSSDCYTTKRAAWREGLTKHGLQVRQRHWSRGGGGRGGAFGNREAALMAVAKDRRGPGWGNGILWSGGSVTQRRGWCFARFRYSELRKEGTRKVLL